MLIYYFLSIIFFTIIILPVYLIAGLFRHDLITRLMGFLKIYKIPVIEGKTIMFHGVSVGEIIAIEDLVNRAHVELPDYKIIVTAGTNTGKELAEKKFKDIAEQVLYFPPDFPPFINAFLKKTHPDAVIIAETEIWPNFSYMVSRKNIPLFIINGRISDHSFKYYKHMSLFFGAIFDKTYTKILTQSEMDRQKFIKMGASPETCEVMGNLKFDIEGKIPEETLIEKGNSRIMIAGSTHKGEDEIVLQAFDKVHKKHPDFKLLLAPRHLTRLDEVAALVEKTGYKYDYYSKNTSFENCDIIILDVIGKLSKLYYFCDIAFLGGSFNKTGGHNPLEASIYNKPVISGPTISNFRGIYSALTTFNAGKVVKTPEEFEAEIFKLLENNEYYKSVCQNCQKAFEQNRGAIDFVINKIKNENEISNTHS